MYIVKLDEWLLSSVIDAGFRHGITMEYPTVLVVIHNYHHFHKRTNRTLFLTPLSLENVQM